MSAGRQSPKQLPDMPKYTAYKRLELFGLSKKLVVACYELTADLPREEKTNFVRYIRTSAISLHLSIAQGAFSRPKKRKKHMRAAENALVIIDAAVGILVEVGFATADQTDPVVSLSASCKRLLEDW